MKTTIYKKDSNGKLRFITIEAVGDSIVQKSGLYGSEKEVTHAKKATPKNVGRANETTGEEQAQLEVDSWIKDKLTNGYFLTIAETSSEVVILPMLAKDYFKEAKKINWAFDLVLIQPKLDGMRCLAFVKKDGTVLLLSRQGKKIENMFHIEKELSELGVDIILDGELYVHGEGFQTNMSYVKKYKEGLSERIIFNVYDIYDIDKPYIQRIKMFPSTPMESVKLLPYLTVYSEDEIKLNFALYIQQGYEGAMVKVSKSGYKSNSRSSELLKYKKFIDIQLPVKDVIPSVQRPEWGTPVYEWKGAVDDILKSGTKMTHEERKDLLVNKHEYIGKMAEIRFFEYSDEGVPRFPVTVGIRQDK